MTPHQISLVQESFAQVEPVADDAATWFYERLFDQHPEVKALFGSDMRKQGAMLMQTLGLAVKNLHQPEKIIEPVQALGRRHIVYGAQPAHYPAVGAALLWTLERGLGDAFTDEVREAWALAYDTLAGIMQDAAAAAQAA